MSEGNSLERVFLFTLVSLAVFHQVCAIEVPLELLAEIESQVGVNFTFSPDATLNCTQLISKYGYHGETHLVTTKDGYILEVHRITGPRLKPKPEGKPVVFLMHGILSSSVDWIISGPGKAFAYILADQGYDVWLGNARGNHYSQAHNKYSVTDKQFWKFSAHEIGIEDLPAMIDYIRVYTNRDKIFYVGHSQGTTSFFIMASEKPEYNDKLISVSALAPIAYCKNMKSPLFKMMARFKKLLHNSMSAFGFHGMDKSSNDLLKKVMSIICPGEFSTRVICQNILFLLTGFGSDQLNAALFPALMGHVPAGASTRQFVHYAQLIKSNEFRQYDHGVFGNNRKYGRITPPPYNLSKITVPVIIHYSRNDWLSSVKDVSRLAKRLPNVYAKLEVPNPKFGHVDYVWGVDASRLIYSQSIALMKHFMN
ncbi:lipase 3 [Diachasma alloeum]|uniref:lipase 3 n=1 Tax=Diachasma alloeum TaxID=454923 RepID=UPI0007382774|nr:lipase 3 [Diachasma alloeum]